MKIKGRLATILIALAFFGCKGPVQTSSASAGEGASAAVAPSSGGAQVKYIVDPTLSNMNAFSVTIPANWNFQGVLFQGGTCAPTPNSVYRAASPDGQSFAEELPPLAWQWGSGPMLSFLPKNDCLPMKGPMAAQDFLQYLAGTMKVQYVGPEAVPADVNAKAQQALQNAIATYAPKYAAAHIQMPKQTRELARADVSYQNGSASMKGRMNATVDCTETAYAGTPTLSAYGGPGRLPQMVQGPGSTVDRCIAAVTYYVAPDSQYASMIKQLDAQGMGVTIVDAWQNAWIQRNAEQSQQAINKMIQQSNAQMAAQRQEFAHDQAVQQQMHDQFMATMQAGTDASMARANASMNARSTAASDWVDLALDQQTVVNTNTGQTSKITNQVTPGGALQKVHGNGTPY